MALSHDSTTGNQSFSDVSDNESTNNNNNINNNIHYYAKHDNNNNKEGRRLPDITGMQDQQYVIDRFHTVQQQQPQDKVAVVLPRPGDECRSTATTTSSNAQLTPAAPSTATAATPVTAAASKKKRRILFSKEQISELEHNFRRHNYLSALERDQLAAALRLTPTQIKIWFQNHRYKLKKLRQEDSSSASGAPAGTAQQLQQQQMLSSVKPQNQATPMALFGPSSAATAVSSGWSDGISTFYHPRTVATSGPFPLSSSKPSPSSSSFTHGLSRCVSIPHQPLHSVGYGADAGAIAADPQQMLPFATRTCGVMQPLPNPSYPMDGADGESKTLLISHRRLNDELTTSAASLIPNHLSSAW